MRGTRPEATSTSPSPWSLPYAVLLLPFLSACGAGPVAPEDQLVRLSESGHFVFFASEGDPTVFDTVYQERHFAWVLTGLALSYPGKVSFLKYRDRAHLERATGRKTNGFAEPDQGRFHTIWTMDNHEYIHVVFVNRVGNPPALFNEGVAVAFHGASLSGSFEGPPLWNGVSSDRLARDMLLAGTLPSLDDLAESKRFRSIDDQVTYPIAGSFVRFLIDRGQIESFKAFAKACGSGSGTAEIKRQFEGVYGTPLASWWGEWKEYLVSEVPS